MWAVGFDGPGSSGILDVHSFWTCSIFFGHQTLGNPLKIGKSSIFGQTLGNPLKIESIEAFSEKIININWVNDDKWMERNRPEQPPYIFPRGRKIGGA
jgi:hypothetical protein